MSILESSTMVEARPGSWRNTLPDLYERTLPRNFFSGGLQGRTVGL